MNSSPTRYRCWLTTPSFCNPKRNPMIPLEQKLLDLNLTVMSHRLETTLSEAAGKNLSAAATLEWLADMELEARHGRAIERRFKCSKLQAQPSIDAFLSSQEPLAEQESRIASARPDLYRQRHQPRSHRKPRGRQDLLVQDRGLARLPVESACPVHHRHGHAQSPARLPGRSFPRPQAQGLYRARTAHLRRTWISGPRPTIVEP